LFSGADGSCRGEGGDGSGQAVKRCAPGHSHGRLFFISIAPACPEIALRTGLSSGVSYGFPLAIWISGAIFIRVSRRK
jgi:hypothetical protein